RLDTQHRWLDILTGLGVPAKFLRNRHGPCPMCPRQPEVRMSMCPVLGTLVPFGIHRTCLEGGTYGPARSSQEHFPRVRSGFSRATVALRACQSPIPTQIK